MLRRVFEGLKTIRIVNVRKTPDAVEQDRQSSPELFPCGQEFPDS